MTDKYEFQIEVDGEEQDAFVTLSSAVEKAAIQRAKEDNMTIPDALHEVTGLPQAWITGE